MTRGVFVEDERTDDQVDGDTVQVDESVEKRAHVTAGMVGVSDSVGPATR